MIERILKTYATCKKKLRMKQVICRMNLGERDIRMTIWIDILMIIDSTLRLSKRIDNIELAGEIEFARVRVFVGVPSSFIYQAV